MKSTWTLLLMAGLLATSACSSDSQQTEGKSTLDLRVTDSRPETAKNAASNLLAITAWINPLAFQMNTPMTTQDSFENLFIVDYASTQTVASGQANLNVKAPPAAAIASLKTWMQASASTDALPASIDPETKIATGMPLVCIDANKNGVLDVPKSGVLLNTDKDDHCPLENQAAVGLVYVDRKVCMDDICLEPGISLLPGTQASAGAPPSPMSNLDGAAPVDHQKVNVMLK